MQKIEKIHSLPIENCFSVALGIVSKIVVIIFNSALLNYKFFVYLTIVKNFLFNNGLFSSANTQKTLKGAIYSALFNFKFLINC